MKKNIKVLMGLFFCCLGASTARADLLGVSPGFPQLNFLNTDPGAVSYDPVSQVLSVKALPIGIQLSSLDLGTPIATNQSFQIQLDTDGNMVSGSNGFVVTGQFTLVNGGVTNSYSGTLLQGNVVAFGYLYSGTVNRFDFGVQLTGGQ